MLKEINPKYSLEGLMVSASVPWPPGAERWLFRKDPVAGKHWEQEENGVIEVKMVGLHHQLNGQEFEQTPRVGNRQRSLACCSPWGCKESDMTEWLKSNNKIHMLKPKPFLPTFRGDSLITQMIENPTASVGDIRDTNLIRGSGRSPGERNGNPLQYSCLENAMDGGAWWATVHGLTKIQALLSD